MSVALCSTAQSMFVQDQEASFQKMIDGVYTETSYHLLDVLHAKYKFMDHLKVRVTASCTTIRFVLALGRGKFLSKFFFLRQRNGLSAGKNIVCREKHRHYKKQNKREKRKEALVSHRIPAK